MRAGIWRILTLSVAVLALPWALDCASTSADKADKVAVRMLNLQKAINDINVQVGATLSSMRALEQPEVDLVSAYKDFSNNVSRLEASRDRARSNAEAAKEQRDEYLSQWQQSQQQIADEQLRSVSETRRAELEPKIDRVRDSLTSARDRFDPFLRDLNDLKLFLGNQLNKDGVAAASDLMTRANNSGREVQQDLTESSAAVHDLAATIQPGAQPQENRPPTGNVNENEQPE